MGGSLGKHFESSRSKCWPLSLNYLLICDIIWNESNDQIFVGHFASSKKVVLVFQVLVGGPGNCCLGLNTTAVITTEARALFYFLSVASCSSSPSLSVVYCCKRIDAVIPGSDKHGAVPCVVTCEIVVLIETDTCLIHTSFYSTVTQWIAFTHPKMLHISRHVLFLL